MSECVVLQGEGEISELVDKNQDIYEGRFHLCVAAKYDDGFVGWGLYLTNDLYKLVFFFVNTLLIYQREPGGIQAGLCRFVVDSGQILNKKFISALPITNTKNLPSSDT